MRSAASSECALQVGRGLAQSRADDPVVLGRIGPQPPFEPLDRRTGAMSGSSG